mgnify:FL=1
MQYGQNILSNYINGRKVYKRSFKKIDGRNLSLYGYKRHDENPLKEDNFEQTKAGELRWHPLRREHVIYTPNRQNRIFKPSITSDPLNPSVKGKKPTEIPFENFELAIFDNKFSSLYSDAPLPSQLSGINTSRAKGHCDVVVYGPESTGNLYSIGQSKRRLLIEAWIDRYESLYNDGYKFVLPFENRGDAVGATLSHPHGQIYAFPFIPKVQNDALKSFNNGYDLSDYIQTNKSEFGVTESDGIEAFCPSFSRFPYEVWLAPKVRREGLWDLKDIEKEGFAFLLGDITRRYDLLFNEPMAYMLSLHSAPLGESGNWHFTAQFYPIMRAKGKIKYLAAVEQSSGTFTVDVMPEVSSKVLRKL